MLQFLKKRTNILGKCARAEIHAKVMLDWGLAHKAAQLL